MIYHCTTPGCIGTTDKKGVTYCAKCSKFDTFDFGNRDTKEKSVKGKKATPKANRNVTPAIHLKDVTAHNGSRYAFFESPESERVFGFGGLMQGSVSMIGGEPGAGKSTWVRQLAGFFSRVHGTVLYVSAEESESQIKQSCERLNFAYDKFLVKTEYVYENILGLIELHKPNLLIIDSINTIYSESDDVSGIAGSPSQVRYLANKIREMSKSTGLTVFMVAHVTKEGDIAGPKALEHEVDTVLYFEVGDIYRFLRCTKTRFGDTSQVGIFEMTSEGMLDVTDPSGLFLSGRPSTICGSAVGVTVDGTRPILYEIEALTEETNGGNPARNVSGLDGRRIKQLCAVISQHTDFVSLGELNVYVSTTNGIKVNESVSDLAVAVAITSVVHKKPVPIDTICLGEVGLTGLLKASIPHLGIRLREAYTRGIRRAIIPHNVRLNDVPPDMQIIRCQTLEDALRQTFGDVIEYNARVKTKRTESSDNTQQNGQWKSMPVSEMIKYD